MAKFISRLAPGRIIALGFALVILLGSGLLMLPCSIQDGVTVRYIDALYTSTSAVCVTGLIAIDAGDTFTPLGQFFLASLIQVGGLGVTAVGAGIILAMRRRVNLKGRNLVREAMNLDSGQGIVRFVHRIFLTTLAFELAGAALSFLSFVQDYEPLDALGISLFHSVAAFNNSGFDIFGGVCALTFATQPVQHYVYSVHFPAVAFRVAASGGKIAYPAALGADIGIDLVFAIPFGDRGHGAFRLAGAARDTIVTDLISHYRAPPYRGILE